MSLWVLAEEEEADLCLPPPLPADPDAALFLFADAELDRLLANSLAAKAACEFAELDRLRTTPAAVADEETSFPSDEEGNAASPADAIESAIVCAISLFSPSPVFIEGGDDPEDID